MSPSPSTFRARAALIALLLGSFAALHGLAFGLLGQAPGWDLSVALAFIAHDIGVNLLLIGAVARARRRLDARPPTGAANASDPARVSVLVAAWNEAAGIEATLRSVLAQEGVVLEVIVADDGSSDDTAAVVQHAFGLTWTGTRAVGGPLTVLRLPHAGKGAALEAARRVAVHPILVTVDADTALSPGALAEIAAPFDDPAVEAAAGAVVVRGADSWLTRFQFTEYLKNTFARVGWSELGGLDQVPGAFAALRASALERAGGFPVDSLTEDYEVSFRLWAQAQRDGRLISIVTEPRARAYTDPPSTLAGLFRQRTRWFAGFLSTLWRHRALVGARGAGAFGGLRLPLKLIDAAVPPIGLSTLAFLVLALVQGTAALGALSASLLVVRWAMDAVVYVHVLDLNARTRSAEEASLARAPHPRFVWACAALETWSYAWLKQFAVLRAYPWALRRVRTWEPSRESSWGPTPSPR